MQSEYKVVGMTDVSALVVGLGEVIAIPCLLGIRTKMIRLDAYKHLPFSFAQVRTLFVSFDVCTVLCFLHQTVQEPDQPFVVRSRWAV